MIVFLVFLLVAGALAYSLLSVIAASRFRMVPRPAALAALEPISVLKPLAGLDDGLEDNLRSFFAQDCPQNYPAFELIFAVRNLADDCVPVVERLRAEFSHVPSRLIITGEPPYPHAKVYSLACMVQEARYDLLVMSDSDIRVEGDFLRRVAAEFADGETALATCPYKAVAGHSFWSRAEALGMNTTFWQGVLTARMLDGMKFAVGPTTITRRKVIDGIGGMERVKNYLAEDFELGKVVAETGARVILSSSIVEHRIGSEDRETNFSHRLRWARTSRRSRPAGYVGQVFTYPVPLALLLAALNPGWWPLLLVTLLVRYASAWTTSQRVLGAKGNWFLLPVEDTLGFVFWFAGFFGNRITWRGRTYLIDRAGKAVSLAE